MRKKHIKNGTCQSLTTALQLHLAVGDTWHMAGEFCWQKMPMLEHATHEAMICVTPRWSMVRGNEGYQLRGCGVQWGACPCCMVWTLHVWHHVCTAGLLREAGCKSHMAKQAQA